MSCLTFLAVQSSKEIGNCFVLYLQRLCKKKKQKTTYFLTYQQRDAFSFWRMWDDCSFPELICVGNAPSEALALCSVEWLCAKKSDRRGFLYRSSTRLPSIWQCLSGLRDNCASLIWLAYVRVLAKHQHSSSALCTDNYNNNYKKEKLECHRFDDFSKVQGVGGYLFAISWFFLFYRGGGKERRNSPW